MASFLAILFLAALIGLVRPYKFAPQVRRWHYGLVALLSFIGVGVTAPPPSANNSGSIKANSSTSTTVPASSENKSSATGTAAPTPEAAGNWSYREQKDEMRGAITRYAELDADNTINLDFPYGEQRGKVLVRQSPQFGLDVLIGVPEGQILCNSFSNSRINVKFDDGPIERFGCTDASDGTNNMVFVQGTKAFLGKLKKSKRLVVEAEFFQNGMQQMSFQTQGLSWD